MWKAWPALWEATRAPPDDAVVLALRLRVGQLLGLEENEVDAHSRYSTWRYNLVMALQRLSCDPDVVLPTRLRDGAPMGIRRHLDPGNGIFPELLSERTVDPDVILKRPPQKNHASFRDRQGLPVHRGTT